MSDVEQQIAAVKARKDKALKDQASAGHAYEVARAQVRASVDALREEFGVNSVEEAEALRTRLQAEIAEEAAAVSAALDKTERQT